jgi:hypothetical protein
MGGWGGLCGRCKKNGTSGYGHLCVQCQLAEKKN